MASYSEIQKLEQRHAENPDGRTFAPLADAYRRAGRLAEAHQLVQAGLLKHPLYVSAHIVLGRCLIDMGDTAGARLAFEQVYAIDSENIIALRTLSELAEGEGRLADAEYWLRQALDVDPMNPDLRDGLERIARAAAEEPAPQPNPLADLAAELAEEEAAGEGFATLQERASLAERTAPEDAPAEDVLRAGGETAGEARGPEPEADDLVIERAAPADAAEGAHLPPPTLDMELEVERVDAEQWREPDVWTTPDSSATEPASPVEDVEIERVSDEGATRTPAPWMPVGIDAGSIVPYDGRIDFSRVAAEEVSPLDFEPDEPEPADPDAADVSPVEGLAATQYESMELIAEGAEPPEASEPPEGAELAEAAEPPGPAEPMELEEPAAWTQPPASIEPVELRELAELRELPELPDLPQLPALPEPAEPAMSQAEPEVDEAAHGPESVTGYPEAAAVEPDDGSADLEALFQETDKARERADSALADLPVFIPDEDDDLGGIESAVEEDYHAADHEALEEAEPVVTETMAELLVSQGHVDEAIRVYRALLAARPDDATLARRLATLEGGPLPVVGQTVGELFRELVAAELTLPEVGSVAEPAHPDVDAELHGAGAEGRPLASGGAIPISLDEVFGESSTGEAPARTEPRASESEPSARPSDPDAFSFDAFFGGETEAPEGAAPPGEDPEGDLDEFQAWLRGLKS